MAVSIHPVGSTNPSKDSLTIAILLLGVGEGKVGFKNKKLPNTPEEKFAVGEIPENVSENRITPATMRLYSLRIKVI